MIEMPIWALVLLCVLALPTAVAGVLISIDILIDLIEGWRWRE